MSALVKLDATVRCSISAYHASIHTARGSSTGAAETAVRRAADKYAADAGLEVRMIGKVSGGRCPVVFARKESADDADTPMPTPEELEAAGQTRLLP